MSEDAAIIEHRGPRRRAGLELAAVALGLLFVAVLIQRALNAYDAEFLGDDHSHYISGLFVRDYIAARLPNPLAYLKSYQSHYPLIGIGHWGPAYYGIEGLWMLLFGTGRAAGLMLSAIFVAATAFSLYLVARPRTGATLALFAALAFLITPMVQESAGEIMLDVPIALLCTLAAFSYVRYLESERAFYSVLFGLIAAVALLVKGNAGCLALLPPLAVLLTRRFRLLRKTSFWLPLPIVAVIAGPWSVLTYNEAAQGFRFAWGADYIAAATSVNLSTLWSQVGPLALAMAGLGLADTIVRGTKAPPWQSGFAALFLSVWIFQTLVPAALQDRYLVPLLPPLFLLALRGIEISAIFAAKRVPIVARSNRSVTASLVLIVAATMMPAALAVQAKQHVGYVEAAQTVWSHRIAANPSVLIVTNNSGEGTAIAELAMLDPARPSLFAVRGSRLLGGGGYNAQDYLPRFQTPEQVMEAIDSYNIPLVLIRPDPSAAAWAHIGQVVEAQHLYPERWELLYHGASGISVYRLRGNAEKTGDTAKLAALSAPKALGE